MKSLIVEDDIINQKLLNKFLKPLGQVDVADNGGIGIDTFQEAHEQKEPYDVIFLDIMMPEVDGQEALKIMRSLENAYNIQGLDRVKVIMTTAMDGSQNIMEAFRSGCEGYLVKPVTRPKLFQQLAKLGLIKKLSQTTHI